MKVAVVVLATISYLHLASGDIHSHTVIYTATSGIQGIPEFVGATIVDGQQVNYYDSTIKELIPKQEWVKGAVDSDFWKRNGAARSNAHQVFKSNIDIARQRFNQTEGVHTVQEMYGCQWDDESGAVNGHWQYGYDGEDFISLDMGNMRWIASRKQSEITKNKWDADKADVAQVRYYLTEQCIEWLKKYVKYGSSTLGRKVAPEVSLIPKSSSEVACHATGFYPDSVMITWKKDGQEVDDDVDVGETLPNEDGTFQKRSVLTVSPEERKNAQYSCEVTHKSGAEPINKILIEAELNRNGNEDSSMGMIIGIIAAVLVVGGLIAGIVVGVLKKKHEKEYDRASSQDTNSNNSNPIVRTEETKKLNPDPSV